MKFIFAVIGISSLMFGCSSTSNSNRSFETTFTSQASTKPIIEVREEISGFGCRSSFLSLFKGGDSKFLTANNIDGSTPEGKAKAAAAYNALYGGQDAKISTDIIVNPVYNVETSGIPIIFEKVCATVAGNRGVIIGYENDTTQ
jgi:hypothetical protein